MLKKLGFLWVLLGWASLVQAGSFPTIPSLTVGGRVFTDLSNLIVLTCWGKTSGNITSCRKMNGTAGYQVTGGKTYNICAIKACSTSGSAGVFQQWNLLYGDTDVGLGTGSSAPTNAVYEFGNAATDISITAVSPAGNGADGNCSYQNFDGPSDYGIPASKYPAAKTLVTAPSMLIMYGYEAHDCSQ